MSPITHFLTGWALANTAKLNPRERMLVAGAGVIPDVDGFGIIVDLATNHATEWWGRFTLYWAWQRGYSPLEIFSKRADAIVISTLRRRFPRRSAADFKGPQ